MNTVTLVTTVVKTTLVAYATLVTNGNIVTRKRMVMLVIIATMYNSVYSNHTNVSNLGEKTTMVTLLSTVVICGRSPQLRFGLVCFGLYVHPFCHTCNIGHVNYRLQFTYYNTTYNIYIYPHNIL